MSTSSRHIALNPDLIGAPYAVTAVLPIGQTACLPLMADIVSFSARFSSPSGAACL